MATTLQQRENPMSRFRVRTDEQWENGFYGRYKGHAIGIERDHPNSEWYIVVTAPNGLPAYDGWWRDSKHKPIREAIEQALRGSLLLK